MANLAQQMFFTALALAFGVLHLVLYLHARQSKSNLYFALFAFLFAANLFFDFQGTLLAGDPSREMFYLRIHRAVMPYASIFALLFIYSLFRARIPRQFWLISLGLIVSGIFAVIDPIGNFVYVQIIQLAVVVEAVRVILAVIKSQRAEAWIVGFGFTMLFVFSMYDMLLDFDLMQPIYGITNGYPFGFVFLIVSMSVYLARDFAKANERILEQERRAGELAMERRLLEAEDARKAKELEEARTLQLSMLPQCVTDIPGLEICFHMTPATEVGGDYYDYHIAADGALTIAVGDATGHGMKAGIMVSIMKSLFVAEAPQLDMPAFLKKCSQIIKQMGLGNLYMAMMLARFKDQKMMASVAGMPPIYIYRNATQSVEEMIVKGMPLGGPAAVPYDTVETSLAAGDTVLLMSDGFPELFNDRDEMLDYARVKELFQQTAHRSPDEIVAHLMIAGRNWQTGRAQNDDITLVVLKVSGG